MCHHGKEEKTLFPALERSGMPTKMGPIAVMLMEHEVTKKLIERIEVSGKIYLDTGDSVQLGVDFREYVEHMRNHLWKENNRLFVMADQRLQMESESVEAELEKTEKNQLAEIQKDRKHYEKIVETVLNNFKQ